MQGRITIMVNPNKEVCAVHKAGGIGLSSSQIFRQGNRAHDNDSQWLDCFVN